VYIGCPNSGNKEWKRGLVCGAFGFTYHDFSLWTQLENGLHDAIIPIIARTLIFAMFKTKQSHVHKQMARWRFHLRHCRSAWS
jgi:hypothetical protein